MPEYSLAFAERLAATARLLASDGLEDAEAKRTVLYLSLLLTEVTLKAMLEQAGVPVEKICKRSHHLAGLVRDLGQCKVEVEIVPNIRKSVPASRLRSCTITHPSGATTVGEILDAEKLGASRYPIKYAMASCRSTIHRSWWPEWRALSTALLSTIGRAFACESPMNNRMESK